MLSKTPAEIARALLDVFGPDGERYLSPHDPAASGRVTLGAAAAHVCSDPAAQTAFLEAFVTQYGHITGWHYFDEPESSFVGYEMVQMALEDLGGVAQTPRAYWAEGHWSAAA